MKYADALELVKGKRRHRFPEDAECMELWRWFQANRRPGVLGWHVPNGGRRSPREGARLKKMGVVPGVADYHFLDARGRFFALEYKTEYGRETEAQMAFRAAVNTNMGYASVAHGLTQAKKTMQTWGLVQE